LPNRAIQNEAAALAGPPLPRFTGHPVVYPLPALQLNWLKRAAYPQGGPNNFLGSGLGQQQRGPAHLEQGRAAAVLNCAGYSGFQKRYVACNLSSLPRGV